ncbi:MAG: sulfotransferase [Bacteroidia bacterium]
MDFQKVEQVPFFFILGKSRSGTTLLQTILDAHPNAMVPVESIFLVYLKKKYFRIKNWNENRVNQFINDLYKERKFRYFWNEDREKLRADLQAIPKNKISFALLCKYIYLNYSSVFTKENIQLIGDKNPVYPFFISDILEVFPDAKFIHLIRDYRDVIVSSREALTNRSAAYFAYEWRDVNERIEKEKAKHSSAFYTLKYEDLITDPEFFLKEVCAFLMLSYSPKILDFYNRPENYFYNKAHDNTRQPINKKSMDKWKSKLSEKEILIADFIAGTFAKKYNYESEDIRKNIFLNVLFWTAMLRQKMEVFIFRWYQKMPIRFKNTKAILAKKFHVFSHHSRAEDRFLKGK